MGFCVVRYFGSKTTKKIPFKVISVGNISSGGVGKSVLTRFLIENLAQQGGAVFLRGYKGENERTGKSFLVSDGNKLFCDPSFSGDEAFMFSQMLDVPVVVGRNRYLSGKLLEKFCREEQKSIKYVVLDDAYQNHKIKKDVEILLLDARSPFGNGHCLPAGPLREKDTSRADIIVLTHAEAVHDLEKIKNGLGGKVVFSGQHKASGLLDARLQEVPLEKLLGKKLLAFAGVGSFTGFLETVRGVGLEVVGTLEYGDHHKYSKMDLDDIRLKIKLDRTSGAITTRKDLHKVVVLLEKFYPDVRFPLYCMDVKFEFLTTKEKESFLALIK